MATSGSWRGSRVVNSAAGGVTRNYQQQRIWHNIALSFLAYLSPLVTYDMTRDNGIKRSCAYRGSIEQRAKL